MDNTKDTKSSIDILETLSLPFDKKVFEKREELKLEENTTYTTINIDLEDEIYKFYKEQADIEGVTVEEYVEYCIYRNIRKLSKKTDLPSLDSAEFICYQDEVFDSGLNFEFFDAVNLQQPAVLMTNQEDLQAFETINKIEELEKNNNSEDSKKED